MKLFLVLALILSASFAFAASDPNFCDGKSSCREGYIPLLKSGTYFARGVGRNCQQAMDNSQKHFFNQFGNMDCGLISGPYVWSCTKVNANRYIAWTRCNPDSGPVHTAPRSRCVMIGGRLVC